MGVSSAEGLSVARDFAYATAVVCLVGGGSTACSSGQDGAGTSAPVTPPSGEVANRLTSAAAGKVHHHERTHYRVVTPTATYLLDSASGGLSSMIDADGNDWIDYKPEPWDEYPPSAASSYRGSPNLVFHSAFAGAGHPGHDRAASELVGKNQIRSWTPDGPWEWIWTFHDTHAELAVTGVSDTAGYWFLYEGPAAGRYVPRETYYASDGSEPAYTQYDHFNGEEEVARRRWYYFGRDGVDRTLHMIQVIPDELDDHYSLLGDDTIGIDSPDGMIVAGFGRAPMAKPVLRTPNRFLLGFSEGGGATPEAYEDKRSGIERLIATATDR